MAQKALARATAPAQAPEGAATENVTAAAGGFAAVPRAAVRQWRTWGSLRLVTVYVELVSRRRGLAWPLAPEAIALATGYSVANVRRMLAELQRLDVIRRRDGRGSGWRFAWLDYPAPGAAPLGDLGEPEPAPERAPEPPTDRPPPPPPLAPSGGPRTRQRRRVERVTGDAFAAPTPYDLDVYLDVDLKPPSLPSYRRAPAPPSEGGRVVETIRGIWPEALEGPALEAWARLAALGLTEEEAIAWVRGPGKAAVGWRSRHAWLALAEVPGLRTWLATHRARSLTFREPTIEDVERAIASREDAGRDVDARLVAALARLRVEPGKACGVKVATLPGGGLRVGYVRERD